MKILYKLITLLWLFTGCIGCNPEQNQEKTPLPSFDVSIEMHENVLVFDNNDGYDDTTGNELNEIVLFDVNQQKKLYNFIFDKKLAIYKIAYNYETDKNNIYVVFLDGRAAKLNVLTGKMNEFENIQLIACPENLTIFNNEVWISPNYPGFENRPVKYFVYTPAIDTSRYEELPEGILSIAKPFKMDNNLYIPLYFGGDNAKIYNYTSQKELDISALDNSLQYSWHDYYNGFLASDSIDNVTIYKVKSTVPKLDVTKLFDIKEKFRALGIYENSNYLFVYGRFPDKRCFLAYAKDDYKLSKTILLYDQSSFSNYVRNGYFYCVKGDTHGVYKISLEDFSVTEIE